jgi:hypothetical protein
MDSSVQEQADAGTGLVNARLKYLAEATPKEVNYTYDPPPESPAGRENTLSIGSSHGWT